MNREQIRNPHLIYPGYVIVLDRERGRLAIAPGTDGPPATAPTATAPTTTAPTTTAPSTPPAPAPSTTATTTTTAPGSTRLGPRVRAESLARTEIPSIPPSIIEPFLTRPLVIEPDGLEKAPTIIATQTDRVILATGNSAYVRGLTASAQDETWYVYRKGPALVDPDTNRTLGYEAIYLGTAQLTRPGQPATILLTSTVQEVEAGDNLVAAGRPQALNYAPRSPGKPIKGRVIGIYGGVAHVGEAGPQSIISINRGKSDGLEVGHVLALYNLGGNVRDMTKPRNAPDALIKLPDERAGLAFVFRVFDRVSYALVMHITRPISPLDVVQTP